MQALAAGAGRASRGRSRAATARSSGRPSVHTPLPIGRSSQAAPSSPAAAAYRPLGGGSGHTTDRGEYGVIKELEDGDGEAKEESTLGGEAPSSALARAALAKDNPAAPSKAQLYAMPSGSRGAPAPSAGKAATPAVQYSAPAPEAAAAAAARSHPEGKEVDDRLDMVTSRTSAVPQATRSVNRPATPTPYARPKVFSVDDIDPAGDVVSAASPEDTAPLIPHVAAVTESGRFKGVVLSRQPPGCAYNITRLSYMVYKLIQSVEVHSVMIMPCRTTIQWMPAVVSQLEFETPAGLTVTCVDTRPDRPQGRLLEAYKDTGATVVNGSLDTIPALPAAQIVVSWHGFQEWGVRGSWDFLGAIKQLGVDWVTFNNHARATNGERPGAAKAINVRKAPYHLGAPARVVKGVALDPKSDVSLVLYDTANMREGM